MGGHGGGDLQGIEQRVLLGFFDEAGDAAVIARLEDAAGLRLKRTHRQCGNGDVGTGFAMLFDHFLKVHPVQLITA